MSPAAPLTISTQTPLPAESHARIVPALEDLDAASLWWLSGYTAGLARAQGATAPTAAIANADSNERTRLTVIYGSQTGNARRVAESLLALFHNDALPVRFVLAGA